MIQGVTQESAVHRKLPVAELSMCRWGSTTLNQTMTIREPSGQKRAPIQRVVARMLRAFSSPG